MGLSHLVATGDEASPDPIAVAREGTLWVSGTLVGRVAATEHPSLAKTAPEQQKRHPGHLPAEPGFLVSRVTCEWSPLWDSNPRPFLYEGNALPLS